jgi:ABC-2 type transport system permease protein
MFMIAFLFTAIGTAIASLLEDMQAFQLIMNFLIMPIFFLSGALFPINDLPPALVTVTSLNPLSYGVDALRGCLVPNSVHFGLGLDFLILGVAIVLLNALGAYLFSKIQV